jgi:ubiquinone/menaquinone biosynthesis C-methylase UbiE
MTIQKQVDKAHYDFNQYVSKARWNSFYHQIDEILKTEPNTILEVGVGAGITKCILKDILNYNYESMDIDVELNPDYIGSILDMPFKDNQYDVIVCFQVLEHLPFDDFDKALSELFRVANKAVIISLPDAKFMMQIHVPKIIEKRLIKIPFVKLKRHVFDGEHYWELNKIGYELDKILRKIKNIGDIYNFVLEKEYHVFENPYHHFFVLKSE